MSAEYTVITNPVLNLRLSNNVTHFESERRFQKDITIADLKVKFPKDPLDKMGQCVQKYGEKHPMWRSVQFPNRGKLELQTGASANHMKLEVFSQDNSSVCKLDNDDAMLGSYPIDDGMRIHVEDKTKTSGEFEDVSKVEKFELSKDDYDKRTDSVRAFKQKMKMGQFREVDPEEQKRLEEEKQQKEQEEKEKAESMKIGDRCEVQVAGQPHKRGVVMYVGLTDFKPGFWIGVKYDEPLGKNDGSVKGKRYFDCPAKYGGFVKPNQVTVGDFPEEGLDDLDEM